MERQCSVQVLIQPWVCALNAHYGWVDQSSVEYKVFPTILHMTSAGNLTPDLLILRPTPILSPTPCHLCHMQT